MLRLSVLRNLQVFSKNLPAFTNFNAVNCKTTDFNQKPHILNAPRQFSFTSIRYCEPHDENAEDVEASEKSEDIDEQALADEVNNGRKVHHMYKRLVGTPRDRTKVIPFEKSIEYLQSGSYKATYGDKKVWELYRRVHKGQLPKTLTRKTCIRSKVVVTGSPCPICRDEYLILDHRNLELLKQFISPFTGEVNKTFEINQNNFFF